LVVCYGDDEARSLFGLTNNIVVFGGGKDIHFYKEISELVGTTRVSRRTLSTGASGIGSSRAVEDTPILRPEHIRLIPERQAVVVAENAPPIIARLRRCVDGKEGRPLLQEQTKAREMVTLARAAISDIGERTDAAVAYARSHRLHAAGDATSAEALTSLQGDAS